MSFLALSLVWFAGATPDFSRSPEKKNDFPFFLWDDPVQNRLFSTRKSRFEGPRKRGFGGKKNCLRKGGGGQGKK